MAKPTPNFRFDDFFLDVANRQLWQKDTRIDLSRRYFDALVLLVREHGQLVEKDRLFQEVWDDVVVGDAALTQCIKDVRRCLGDSATQPRYIETVPRFGYRFVGRVEVDDPAQVATQESGAGSDPPTALPLETAPPGAATAPPLETTPSAATTAPPLQTPPKTSTPLEALQASLWWGAAGTLGGGFAGVIGGLLYGSGLAFAPTEASLGSASILVVLVSFSAMLGLVAGFGVSFGMAAVSFIAHRAPRWSILGGMLGGMFVGGMTKLLGLDAFTLFFGLAPAGITGGMEGAALGAAVGLGAVVGNRLIRSKTDSSSSMRPVVGSAILCAITGVLIPIAGGHLLGGSLELLAGAFSGTNLQLDSMGRYFGEVQFGFTSEIVLGGVEGLLFGTCVAGALVLARRPRSPKNGGPAV